MAKGKRKSTKNGRVNGHQNGGSQCGTSDDESVETSSVFSSDSQYPNRNSSDIDDADETVAVEEHDTFEDKLKEAIEGTTEKSAKNRAICMQALCKALSSRFCIDFLADRPTTMTDIVEKGLKKGRGTDEQGSAATLAALLCIQYGATNESSDIFKNLHKLLTCMLLDQTLNAAVREKVANALGVSAFVAESDNNLSVQTLMDSLRSVFSGSYLKGDGSTPAVIPAVAQLHASCLLSWALLLTVCPLDIVQHMVNSHLCDIEGILESTDVDLRIAAGEAIATMYELARERDTEFEGDSIDVLCATLHQLATDSQKFRAKKDRKVQRSSFRDIYRAVKEGENPDILIRFAPSEVLRIHSWSQKRHYDAFCALLGSGMNHHLSQNDLLRDIFGLGVPVIANGTAAGSRVSKFERHMVNVASDRARTKCRSKLRDKRADVM